MKNRNIVEYRVQGDAILERMTAQGVPKSLSAYVKAFAGEHRNHLAAAEKAGAAEALRREALEAVGHADAELDQQVLLLANRMVGAGLGDRKNPFNGYSKYAPGKLTNLGYAAEVEAVRALCQTLARAKPPTDVAAALKQCLAAAGVVESKLKGLAAPQAAYAKALADRDATIVTWTKALARLKLHAQLAFEDDAATFKALFAPAAQMVTPTRKRKSKPGAPQPAPAK